MTENLFNEKLNLFKQNEKPEAVLIIANNPELIRISIAWTNIQVKQNLILTELSEESDAQVWLWLWENTNFKLAELKNNSGVSYSETVLQDKLKLLIGNKVLFPDGSVNSFVQRYLRECVAKLFSAKPKPSTKA